MPRQHRAREGEREHRRGSPQRGRSEDGGRRPAPGDDGSGAGRDKDYDPSTSPYGGREFADPARRPGAARRYRTPDYGSGDIDCRDDWGEPYDPAYRHAPRPQRPTDSWSSRRSGNFSDSRTRWPGDDVAGDERRDGSRRPRSERPVSEYGYFDETAEGSGMNGEDDRSE